MNFDDYERLPSQHVAAHMAAGAIAGVMEHCLMYPLDSVKTRMQSLGVTGNDTVLGTLRHMVRSEGALRPVRGMSAVVAGAGPAHALYFSTYEFSKESLGRMTKHRHEHFVHGLSGCFASIVHDGISNPTEVVKQRLQMYNSPYRGVLQCVGQVYRSEGVRAFYRSYLTTLTMNVPFQCIHVTAYETLQKMTNRERSYNPLAHIVSGAVAGAMAAAATTPLDVCKTVLNTQEPGAKAKGFKEAVDSVLRLGGPRGFFKGLRARVLYQMPAAAICWSTYETFKFLLRGPEPDPPRISDKHNKKAEVASSPATDPPQDALKGIKSMEMPAVNGANLYGALSLNTVHHGDCQVPALRHT